MINNNPFGKPERLLASKTAANWLSDPDNLVVLDTETTGLGSDAEVIELSAINGYGEVLIDTLIKPVYPVPYEAIDVHGITNYMLADKRTWLDIKDEFEKIISGKTVVAYNSGYDARLIKQSYETHGLTIPAHIEQNLIGNCAMLVYASFNGEWDSHREQWKWQRLTNAAEQCNIKAKGAHRALADARMTLGVIDFMAENRDFTTYELAALKTLNNMNKGD